MGDLAAIGGGLQCCRVVRRAGGGSSGGCRRIQGGTFSRATGNSRVRRAAGVCRVQEECSRHGLVVLWVRVQRAGGAARGEGGELQGIGERARGGRALVYRRGKREEWRAQQGCRVGGWPRYGGGSPAAGGVCWVVHSLGLVYPGVREEGRGERSGGRMRWCSRWFLGLPGGKAAGGGVMNRNDTAAGTGLLGGGLPGGKKRKERQPARVGGAGEGGGVCQLANLSTFRLVDFSTFRFVGKLEIWRGAGCQGWVAEVSRRAAGFWFTRRGKRREGVGVMRCERYARGSSAGCGV